MSALLTQSVGGRPYPCAFLLVASGPLCFPPKNLPSEAPVASEASFFVRRHSAVTSYVLHPKAIHGHLHSQSFVPLCRSSYYLFSLCVCAAVCVGEGAMSIGTDRDLRPAPTLLNKRLAQPILAVSETTGTKPEHAQRFSRTWKKEAIADRRSCHRSHNQPTTPGQCRGKSGPQLSVPKVRPFRNTKLLRRTWRGCRTDPNT